MWAFFLEHPVFVTIAVLLPVWGIIELVVALTPTKKDDAAWKRVRDIIIALLNLIPRFKKGGGKFN